MPNNTQIIPQWSFPNEEVHVIDNSAEILTNESETNATYPYLCVFAGPKGPDNKLVNIKTLAAYRKMFGNTNFKKYGQAHMMPEALLSQSGTSVWCMRVMPTDAAFANAVVSLWYKEDAEAGKFRIKFTTKSIGLDYEGVSEDEMKEILADRDKLIGLAAELDGAATDGVYVDAEGYTQVPLMVFTAIGRGSYGQNLRWRISPNTTYEKDYEAKVYTFECIDVESGATVVKRFNSMIVPSTVSDTSIFINDVVDDVDYADLPMHIHVFEDNMIDLYEAYKAFCNAQIAADPSLEITIPEMYEFDPFFGNECKKDGVRNTPKQPFISFTTELTADVDIAAEDYNAADYTSSLGLVDVNAIAGNDITNGSDGSFVDENGALNQEAVDAAYIDAFSGNLDRLILAPRRVPSTVLFDANYSTDVKMALAQLAFYRASSYLYLDTGLIKTLGSTDIKTLETEFAPIDEISAQYENLDGSWILSVNTHWFYVREASTGRRVPVTITYYLAATDAIFRQNEGSTSPRTNSSAILSGHIKDSLQPSIEENDRELKQALYDARINYFEATGENTFERATQSSFIRGYKSDLLEEPNAIAILEWKRILEDEVRVNRNRMTSPKKRAEFRDRMLEKYNYLIGDRFATMDIVFTANEYEQKRDIVHLYTQVTFPSISKVTIVEIQVNKREYEADEEE